MNAIALALKLLPIITFAIKTVEEVGVELKDPNANKSAVKLQAAKDIVRQIYDSSNPTVPFDNLIQPIENIIALIVQFYNAKGLFKKG